MRTRYKERGGPGGKFPDLAVKGVTLRKFGQEIIQVLGGKKVHPWHSIPGGVNRSLKPGEVDVIRSQIPAMKDIVREAIGLAKGYLEENAENAATFATLETAYMALFRTGSWIYDGDIR